jgi:hypothetical protein
MKELWRKRNQTAAREEKETNEERETIQQVMV